jgi:hypothetical protein
MKLLIVSEWENPHEDQTLMCSEVHEKDDEIVLWESIIDQYSFPMDDGVEHTIDNMKAHIMDTNGIHEYFIHDIFEIQGSVERIMYFNGK